MRGSRFKDDKAVKSPKTVIQTLLKLLDSGFHRNDILRGFLTFYKAINVQASEDLKRINPNEI